MEKIGDFGLAITAKASVDDTVRALDQELKNHKFAILWDLDMKEKLAEKGIPGGPNFRVLEVCSAPRAKQALDSDLNVGYFLPCKIVVYDRKGTTHIGLQRPSLMTGFFDNPTLTALGDEVEKELIAALEAVAHAAV